MVKAKFATQEYYDLWAKTLSEDPIMNGTNMNDKWAYVFTDKLDKDDLPLTWIATWYNGKVSVKPGKFGEPVDATFTSDYSTWAKVTNGSIYSQTASVTNRYKVEGSFSKLMKNAKALLHMAELVKKLNVEY